MILSSTLTKIALPFFLGTFTGVIGSHVVTWRKKERSPSRTFRMITLAENISNVKDISLCDFKKKVTISELNVLRKSVGWATRTAKIWNGVFKRATFTIIVKKSNQLIAYASFVGNGRMGTIFDVHVHPEHQNQKIGTLLMNHLVSYIKSKDYSFVGLFGWEENKNILNFYEKFGFKPNPFGMESSSINLKWVDG